uniref:DNA-directed RNA polymerase subunit beta n=1 Tax=Caenorhabditis japonica TaxID=281687 RepID=A0A8R1DTA8_CAEJA
MDCDIASYHVESFNFLVTEGCQFAAQAVPAEKFRLKNGDAVTMKFTSAQLHKPTLDSGAKLSSDTLPLLPAECRQRGLTYAGNLKVGIDVHVNGSRLDLIETILGKVPIMLRSEGCHLRGLSRKELVAAGEEPIEKGGYFIVNGSEKVIRLLIANRRNFPIAIIRKTFKEKGKLFSEFGVMMRSVKENHTAVMMTLHYLDTGTMQLALQFRREIFYVPLMYIMKALCDKNDAVISSFLTRGRPGDQFFASCVMNMLAQCQEEGILHQEAAIRALGSRFRVAISDRIAPWEDDLEAGRFILRECVCVHLDSDEEKFYTLAYMAQKCVALVKGECAPETPDNPQFQEASVSGHILLLILRERMENIIGMVRRKLEFMSARKDFILTSAAILKALGNHNGGEITRGMAYFLATGNLVTRVGLALQQESGFSVIAERINQLRFVSHFRAIHRGAFFMEMRTTDVRKLRPEAWGFICPVHTPDGAPCGLLNHVTASCRIVTHLSDNSNVPAMLSELGMYTHQTVSLAPPNEQLYPVLMDGRFIGYVPIVKAASIERYLRCAKVANDARIPYTAEIALVRRSTDIKNVQTQYPGIYILSDPGRLIRPVRNLAMDSVEHIGTFEQVYLSVVIDPEEAQPGVTMHQELHPSCLFSFAGNLIPFPDHNQSPRNVYQCQMGKQTMGTAVHAWHSRADNKMYKLQFPQQPLLKLEAYEKYEMDEYPLGTNACVAVISYTGYDMEDAMTINKASYQRGFAHGTVIKVERINLVTDTERKTIFHKSPSEEINTVGSDGLPIPGRRYFMDEVYYVTFNMETGAFKTHKFHYAEPAYCGFVRIVQQGDGDAGAKHALIQWRIERNPIIGDKFASRHGQKGINSFLWPVESLPFSETGMVPDIIFNPHGFPSRMTIGMMIESMAGKAAATHGESYDASPFVFNEENTAINHFGELLTKAGYNYYGNETFYSGVDGRQMEMQIFFGIVYYQRLRHMIADKFQVRATGPIDPITHQPVKGRKKGGGIRFGEMERDAIIAHGTSFVLQDRLLNCSDRDLAYACRRCGSLLSVLMSSRAGSHLLKKKKNNLDDNEPIDYTETQRCRTCFQDDQVYLLQVPRVFRYLTAELAAMNVKIKLGIEHPSKITGS